jgi:DNA-binding SARP family transcriptional activator/class 3 adenylate cyclase
VVVVMTRPGGGLAAADIVTLLFTDLVGSTELLQSLGDDTAEAVRRSHFRLLRDVVAVNGGHEVKNLGDGLMVVFGSALDALRSAVAMQQAVSLHNRRAEGPPFEIRVGLHVGEPARDGDDYFGTPVVVAKRLCDAAGGGQILASQLLAGLVGSRGGFELRALGPLELKGLVEPVQTVEVAWVAENPEAVAAPAGVRLLGPLEVIATGGPASRAVEIGSPKQRAVLAVLALHRNEVVSRELLLDRLWGDRPPASATVTLRSLVSRLRKAIDGVAAGFEIATREPGWILRCEPGVVDAARFSALTAEARLRLAAGDPATAALTLRTALQLWRGSALVDVVDAGYLAAEATQLDEARLDAVENLVEAELASGWPGEALVSLEPHVAANPLRERAWGQLMVALYHLGRQAEALRAYQRLRALLREELGLDPTPALADLEARILRHDPALAPPPAAPILVGDGRRSSEIATGVTVSGPGAGSSQAERTPFVGRAAERAVLAGALERARAGSGGMVLIGGEPGIGKTRLAEEVAADAAAACMNVLVGHCYEMAAAAPYPPIVEILDSALAAAPSAEVFVADVLGDAAPEIARLLPELRRRFPDLPPPLELPPDQERHYLFRCMGEILARAARARPLLIVLDDLQWADDATLLFVEHLAPLLASLPCLVVATYRDTDVGRPLARTFGDLHRRRLAVRITLGALNPAEAGELIAGLSGQDPPPALVDALHAATEGNVFFLEEIVRDLAEGGQAFDATGRFRTDVDVAELGLPEGVRLVIERRLDRLSEPARALLTAAAVTGRVFTVALLTALGDIEGDDVLDIVDEAEQAVLIAPTANADEFLFAHELIRQTLVAALSGTRRRRLHFRAAEALEHVHADDVGVAAATIAHHLLEAGPAADPAHTFRYLTLAGEAAMDASAFEEALRHFEAALHLGQAASPRESADLRAGLGRAHRSLRHSDQAIENWREAMVAYAALGDAEREAQLCAELAWHLIWGVRWSEALDLTDRGLALIGPGPSAARVSLLVIRCYAFGGGERYEEANETRQAALELADNLGDIRLRGQALSVSAALDWVARSRFADTVEEGRRAAAMLKEAGALYEYVEALMYVQLALHPLGRWDEAAALDEELTPMAERLGHHQAVLVCGRERGGRQRNLQPDLARYAEFAHGDLALHQESGLGWRSQSHIFLALADFWPGRWSEALGHATEATRLETTPNTISLWSWAMRLLISAYAGAPADTRRLFQELSHRIPAVGQPAGLGPSQLGFSAVEALAVIGDRDEAAALYPLVMQAIDSGAVLDGYIHGRQLHMLAGIAAASGGRYSEAERHFETALAEAARLGQVMERPDILRFYGQMLAERAGPGDSVRARSMLTEAEETFSALGMPRHAALANAACMAVAASH